MPLNVNLTPELEAMVRDKVASGYYGSASEGVREALRLMEERDQLRAAKLGQLRREIQVGIESGPAGERDSAEIKQRARTRLARHRSR